LATAERLLAERAVHDISIDDLAKGAGISRPTFYFYFPSKEAVILTLLDRVAEEVRRRPARAGERVSEDLAEIHTTFRVHAPVMFAVAQIVGESEEAGKLWGEILEEFVAGVTAAIESELERGAALEGIAPRSLAIALVWMLERVLHTSLAGQQPALGLDDALDIVLGVWSRAIYGNDTFGG